MATLSRGKTFGATETVTNTKLHNLIDLGGIANIITSDFDLTKASPFEISSTTPSAPAAGRAWYDTSNGLPRYHDGTTFQPFIGGRILTNESGGALAAGDVVVIDTANDNAVTTTTTANDTDVLGVVKVGGADQTEVLVITEGYVDAVTVTGSTDNGDFLSTSTTVKEADPSATFGTGSFGRAITTSAVSVAAFLGGATATAQSGGARLTATDVVTATVDSTAGNGTQVIAHSLGILPSQVNAWGSVTGGSFSGNNSWGTAFLTSASTTENACMYTGSSVGENFQSSVACAANGQDASNVMLVAITSATTTNFTITRTSTGTPGSGTQNLTFILAA